MGESTLELLQRFPGYSRFIWERIRGLVRIEGAVLEMGCGIGTMSRLILDSPGVTALDAVDLERAYVERVAREIQDPRLRAIESTAEAFAPVEGRYDRVVSVNVLEHVRDDLAALRNFARGLRPGGECAILVPAHPSLHSSLDVNLSHHRRYTSRSLAGAARQAGLEPARIVHFNPLGALGWWLNGKILRRPALPEGQVALYAKLGIHLSRWFDRINPFPIGISLIARLVKPS